MGWFKKITGVSSKKVTEPITKAYDSTLGDIINPSNLLVRKATGLSNTQQAEIGAALAALTAAAGYATAGAGTTATTGAANLSPSLVDGSITTVPAAAGGMSALAAGGTGMGIGSFLSNNLGGILSGVGSLASGLIGANSAKKAAEISANNAENLNQMQLDWLREAAKNAHQWEVEDLRKAGLNPILSAGGSGANTGNLSPIAPDTSGYQMQGQNMMNAIQTGLQMINEMKRINIEGLQAEAMANQANASAARERINTVGDAIKNGYLPRQQEAEIRQKLASAANMTANTELTSAKTLSEKGTYNYWRNGVVKAAEKGLKAITTDFVKSMQRRNERLRQQ